MKYSFLRGLIRRLGFEIHRLPFSALIAQRKAAYERLASVSFKPRKLHFGCGPRVLRGWINIDLVYSPFQKEIHSYGNTYPPELRGDANDFFGFDVTVTGLPLPDNSVDAVFHEDFIEHLSQKDQIAFLAETFRVLKPGCVHRVNTPNLVSSMRDHSRVGAGMRGFYVGEWDRYHHISVLTPRALDEYARMTGYRSIVFNARNQSISPQMPLEFRPSHDSVEHDRPESDGNIFADLVK